MDELRIPTPHVMSIGAIRNPKSVLHGWLEVAPGSLRDLRRLEPYHYREPHRGPFKAIYVLRPRVRNSIFHGPDRQDRPCRGTTGERRQTHPSSIAHCPSSSVFSASSAVDPSLSAEMAPFDPAGVVLYTMPTPNCRLRDAATGGMFKGFDRATQLAMLNARLRCISRVIIDPRFRGLGLAGRLVRETMPLLDVPIIEARAVMGRFHPFFEQAGMQAWDGPAPPRCTRLAAAFESAGITQRDLIDAQRTQGLLDALDEPRRSFVEREMALFLKCYGKRRNMPPGLQRTRFVLTRLMGPPVYYVWFNPRYGDPRPTTQDSRRTIDASQPTTREVGCRPFTRRKAVPRASGPRTRVSRPRNVAWACSPCTVGRIRPLPVSPRPLPSAKAATPVAVPPAGCPPAPSSIVPHPSSVVERIPIVSRETAARFIAAHIEARCHGVRKETQAMAASVEDGTHRTDKPGLEGLAGRPARMTGSRIKCGMIYSACGMAYLACGAWLLQFWLDALRLDEASIPSRCEGMPSGAPDGA